MSIRHVEEETEPVEDADEIERPPVSFPFPLYTYILLACIGLVFFAQFLTTADSNLVLTDGTSARVAGFDKIAFLQKHEYWRILTGTVLHLGVVHLLMNGYALFSFGRLIEMLSNRAQLAIVFLLSALGGGVLSLIVNPVGVSVGASGGIVGFLSYLAVYAFKRRKFISAEFRKNLLVNIGFLLVFGLVLFKVIDNSAHIGGLIVGAMYGFFQIPGDEYVDPRSASPLVQRLGLAALGVCILTSLLTIVLLFNAH